VDEHTYCALCIPYLKEKMTVRSWWVVVQRGADTWCWRLVHSLVIVEDLGRNVVCDLATTNRWRNNLRMCQEKERRDLG
jgi:hypothetical protein